MIDKTFNFLFPPYEGMTLHGFISGNSYEGKHMSEGGTYGTVGKSRQK